MSSPQASLPSITRPPNSAHLADARLRLARCIATQGDTLAAFPLAGLLDCWQPSNGPNQDAEAREARLVQGVLHCWATRLSRHLDTFPPATSDCLHHIRQELAAARDAIQALMQTVDPLLDGGFADAPASREPCPA